jgi:hypothetical protein
MSVFNESPSVGATEELDYGSVSPDSVVRGAPGLGFHVRLITLLHAEMCLLMLGGRASTPNVLLFDISPLPGAGRAPVRERAHQGCAV